MLPGSSSPPPPGAFGPYRIKAELGRGGYGIVYQCEHEKSGKLAAVKTIVMPHAAVLASIRREVQVLARVQHAGVVPILEHRLEGSSPWYAMEFVQGPTLLDYCRASWDPETLSNPLLSREVVPGRDSELETRLHPLPRAGLEPFARDLFPDEEAGHDIIPLEDRPNIVPEALERILDVTRKLCLTLSFLHSKGIVHRDLKPANVLLRDDASPVLVDFGLMTHGGSGQDHLTWLNTFGGTVAYMAPELLRGELLDVRVDLYALGCMLYELLTGRPPFVGSGTEQVMEQHKSVAPLPPSFFVAGLPPTLDALVLQLLKKDRRERIGYAADVASTIARLQGLPPGGSTNLVAPYLYRPALVGRQDVLQDLRRRVDLLDGKRRGGIVMVGGESGVGKTRLMIELIQGRDPRYYHVFTGECLTGSESVHEGVQHVIPLHPLRRPFELICDRCTQLGPEYFKRILGAKASVLAPYLPAIAQLEGVPALTPPPPLSPQDSRSRVFQSLAEVLESLAEEMPVLLILDDLQWADELTLGFLQYLARIDFMAFNPILLVGTYRQEEQTGELQRLLAMPTVHSIHLARLDSPAVSSIIRDMLAVSEIPAQFVTQLTSFSAGNPFFVSECLRSAVSEGRIWRDVMGRWSLHLPDTEGFFPDDAPLSMSEALLTLIQRRLRHLQFNHVKIAQLAAMVGRECPADLLEWICLQEHLPWVDGIQELILRQVLEDAENGVLRFVHDKLREAVLDGISRDTLSALHRRIAEGMERFAESHPPALGILGQHWRDAGELERARDYFLADARRATEAELLPEAQRLYGAYLDLEPPPSIERLQARIEHLRLRRSLQAPALEQLLVAATQNLSEAEALGETALEAECLGVVADLYSRSGNFEQARALHSRTMRLYESLGDQEGIAKTLSRIAMNHFRRNELSEAYDLWAQSLEIMRQCGNRLSEQSSLNNMALVLHRQGRLDEAEALFLESYQVCKARGELSEEPPVLINLCLAHIRRGDLDEVARIGRRAVQIVLDTGYIFYLPNYVFSYLAILKLQRAVDSMLPMRVTLERLLRRVEDVNSRALLQICQCIIELELNNLENARQMGEAAFPPMSKGPEDRIFAYQRMLMGQIQIAQHNYGEGRRLLHEALVCARRVHEWDHVVNIQVLASALELEIPGEPRGDLQLAKTLAEEAIAICREWRSRLFEVYALSQRGLVAIALGENPLPWRDAVRPLAAELKVSPHSVVWTHYLAFEKALE